MGKSNGAGNGDGQREMTEREIANMLSMRYRIPTIDLDQYVTAPEILALVPRELCEKLIVLPVSRAGNALIVAAHGLRNRASDCGARVDPRGHSQVLRQMTESPAVLSIATCERTAGDSKEPSAAGATHAAPGTALRAW